MTDKKIRTVLTWSPEEMERICRSYASWIQRTGENKTKNQYMKRIILEKVSENEAQ